MPHFAQPVTVVRDDSEGLVVWLATGTPVLRAARADGLGKRDDQSTLLKPHIRDEHTVYTSDHVLDLVIEPDRTMVRKDEDELVLAVTQGVFDATAATAIEAEAAAALTACLAASLFSVTIYR